MSTTVSGGPAKPIDDVEHCLLACAGYIAGSSLLVKSQILELIRETRE